LIPKETFKHLCCLFKHSIVKIIRWLVIWVPYRIYRGADKPLAQPGRKQANVSVRIV